MIRRIHILGASGSGTTTLGDALHRTCGCAHFDTDDYFWQTKYSVIRDTQERLALIENDLKRHDAWVLSGSLCGWGDPLIRYFDLVVLLLIPQSVRKLRLEQREQSRYGDTILPGRCRHAEHAEFMDWALRYDEGDETVRSRKLHETWIEKLPCPVLNIDGTHTVAEELELVVRAITGSGRRCHC